MKKHQIDSYLKEPTHPITVTVIGCGGTGAYVVSQLAKLAVTLRVLKDIELFVTVIDDDKVEEHNVGRQLYSPSDIGFYKSTVMVERVNRFFGLDWVSEVRRVTSPVHSNIVITCVDNIACRKVISKTKEIHSTDLHKNCFYWLDFGNSKDYGQFVLSTFQKVKQPKGSSYASELPNIFQLFGKIKESKSEPSCSMAESLNQQDLFINLQVATAGISLLWKLLKDGMISYHGQFLNLETGNTRPINIK